jgi:hypothetical protein
MRRCCHSYPCFSYVACPSMIAFKAFIVGFMQFVLCLDLGFFWGLLSFLDYRIKVFIQFGRKFWPLFLQNVSPITLLTLFRESNSMHTMLLRFTPLIIVVLFAFFQPSFQWHLLWKGSVTVTFKFTDLFCRSC